MNVNMTKMENLESGLYIVSTPIGNLSDLSNRATKILNMVDFIICENPYHSLKLLNKLGIKKKLFSLHDYNEEKVIKKIEKYQNNSSIALISDAGAPLISDPGYNLVLNYIQKDIMITTIPGPSSIISALQLSGFPIHNFRFFGFVPKNNKAINNLLKEIENFENTSVLFVSGNRLSQLLEQLIDIPILRKISVCKEITKKNEKIFRGNAENIIKLISLDNKSLKGEFVIVIEGKKIKAQKRPDIEIQQQMKKLLKKYSLTEVVQIVHKLTHISKKEIYKTALLLND